MSDVTLRNPSVGADQWITVSSESLPHYARAGWVQVPDKEVADRAEAKRQEQKAALDAMAAPAADPDGDPVPVDAQPPADPADAAPAADPAPESGPESEAAAPKKRSR